MQPASPIELVAVILISILIMFFFLAVIVLAVKSGNEADRQRTERERIRHMPNSVREGRLLIRRKNPDGSFQDLSLDTLSVDRVKSGANIEPETKHLPYNKRQQIKWQPRNHRKNGGEVVVYRGNYPSKPREFYREEDD